MRPRTSRRAFFWFCSAFWIGPVVLACNSLTGVNDLEFAEPLPPEDAVSMNPLQPCDALTGEGCPTGETCRLSLEQGGPACQPAPATAVAPYAACERDAQCPAAHRCVAGVCAELCQVEADCGWQDARCRDVGAGTLGFGHCTRNCELASPVAPAEGFQPCGAGTRCDFTAAGTSSGYTDCVAAAPTSTEGGTCQANTDCPAGLACSAGRCQRYCDAGDNACPVGLTCAGVEARGAQQVGTCCQIPAGDACDSVSDCGCGAGETCGWDGNTGATLCRPLADVVLDSGDTCNLDEQCPQSHSCVAGTCSQHCYFASDCEEQGSVCTGVSFGQGTIAGRSVCSAACDPLFRSNPDFTPCRAGTSCIKYADVAGRPDYFSCGVPGTVPENGACSVNPDCASGLACFGSSCQRWCATAADCGAGFTCSSVIEQGGFELGFCAPQAAAVGPFEACVSDAECPAQHVCANGACSPLCGSSADCGSPDAICYALNGTTTSVCTRSCDPLSPRAPAAGFEPCGEGLTCVDLFVDATNLGFTCARPGDTAEGGSCSTTETPAPCQDGLSCFAVCQQYCEVGTTCDTGDCLVTSPAFPVVNGRQMGICPSP